MPLLLVIAVAVGVYFLFFAEEDRWSGFVYPNANNLAIDHPIGDYLTFQECQEAAIGLIRRRGWENADYECGLNCELKPFASYNVCEETRS